MKKLHATRLLGRPQPQIYPPVALNQYTWVNRTHFNIDFTPKLSSPQHAKYGSNLMNFFYNLFSIFGGSWGTICWIQVLKCHEDLITLETCTTRKNKAWSAIFFMFKFPRSTIWRNHLPFKLTNIFLLNVWNSIKREENMKYWKQNS